MHRESRIFIAGHNGLVGSAIIRKLKEKAYNNIIFRERKDLDLLKQEQVKKFFESEQVDYSILAAAKVGGILYNSNCQADFLYENCQIALNVIKFAAENKVKKLLYLGSSCIYPRFAPQPILESYLMTGQLEPTNEGYALAKIVGLKLCEKYNLQYGTNFISAMPTNLFGPKDNFHPENSHVIPGLMRRFHEAKINNDSTVEIWGSGNPRREFLYVDDLADALVLLLEKYDDNQTINIGTGVDQTIIETATIIKEVVGYRGNIVTNLSKPDGMFRKVLDVSKIKSLGWQPKHDFISGIEKTYKWALENNAFD